MTFPRTPPATKQAAWVYALNLLSPAPRGKGNRTVRDCRTVELSPACLAVEAGDISVRVAVERTTRSAKGNQKREVWAASACGLMQAGENQIRSRSSAPW